jgi:hypothetical protein
MNDVSPKEPCLDPQTRRLSRFYKPLVLLYTLGRTRGERTCPTMPPREDLAHLPLTESIQPYERALAPRGKGFVLVL